MIIYLSHDDGDGDDDDDDDLEKLHLDWVTARPCIACALNPTINTEPMMRVTTMMRMCSTTYYYYGLQLAGLPFLGEDCHCLGTSDSHTNRPKGQLVD